MPARIQAFKALWRLLLALGLLYTLSGCQKPVAEKDLVGKWQSSRSTNPIHLHTNVEWEIKKEDGTVLQYGIWRISGRNIIWSFKAGAAISHDGDPILFSSATEFHVREDDGSITIFKRLN